MSLKTFKPYTKTTRGTVLTSRDGLWKGKPHKPLTSANNSSRGRNNYGRITSRNHGGGHFNHSMFWEIMGPVNGEMSSELNTALLDAFGSLDDFKTEFHKAGMTRFGSGWAWLCVNNEGTLCVCSTPNQDNPLMERHCGETPILALDVWEHAYYLNYQNLRPNYINAWWNVVDWGAAEERFNS